MPEFDDKVEIEAKCKKATKKAILCRINKEDVWIPLSQVDDESEVWREGDEGKLVISQWIAEQKGLG